MNKTFSKVLALVMCLLVVASAFVGCKKDDGNTASTLVIGATGPLSGDAASYGLSVQNGANLAIKEINAKGGLNGITFKFEMIDDEAKAEKVTDAYGALLAKGMKVAIGSVTSGACMTFAEQSLEDNLFFITPSASADDAIKNDNGYRICFGDPDQGTYAADALAAEYTKIGVIYNNDDAYSTGLLAGFETKMAALGKADAYVKKAFTDSTKTAFGTQVSELKAAGCDVIFLPIYYQEAYLIISEAETQAYDVDFYGCDGMDGIVKHAGTNGKDKIAGLRYLAPIDVESTDAKIKAFVDAYKVEYNGEVPDQFAADAYDAIYVIYESLKAANFDDASVEATVICDKITAVLQNGFSYAGVTGTMTWNKGGAAVKSPVTVTIQ